MSDFAGALEKRLAVIRAEQLERAARIPESLTGADRLTERQREVIALVLDGASNSEIATALGTSSKTVRNHLTAIQRKTETRNRTHLAAVAARAQARDAIDPVAVAF
jgi:DNA-binding CsgD family transcriptional regulator